MHFIAVEDRDVAYAHASNLAGQNGKAGVRLEIPEHLRADFRLLENHGNIIRTALGPDIRRSIRFDVADQALVLNAKHA